MIIDYDVNSTIGHGRGYPTGLEHSEKIDVIACLLDEGERSYVNDEHTAWICSDQCAVGEMVTLDESSTMEHTIVRKAKVPKYNTTQTEDTMEAFGQFVIKAQEAFKGSSGAGADLTIMVESYRTLSYIKQLAYISNKSVQPIEEIQAYYGVDNIDFLGTTHADGGSMLGEKDYIAFDIRNAPLTVLYSKSSGTTVAPITSDENIADFYPIIEIMRKDIYDELPQYTKLFIQSKVGVLLNKPHLALTGKCRP